MGISEPANMSGKPYPSPQRKSPGFTGASWEQEICSTRQGLTLLNTPVAGIRIVTGVWLFQNQPLQFSNPATNAAIVSALPPKAAAAFGDRRVRFGPIADTPTPRKIPGAVAEACLDKA
jgi:hypothetical protein